MIYILSIIFVLSVLVFFHELGHFIFAKLFGVRVERFSIGFPPRLIGIKLGETDYCISAIPFGGYVKMSGVVDESMDTSTLKGEPYEFASKKLWQKVLILIGGVSMNIALAWIIMSGLLHFEGEPVLPSTTIGQMVEEGIADRAGMQIGDKILAINQVPVNTWNDVRDKYLENLGSNIHFEIERNSEIINLTISKNLLRQKNSEILDVFPVLPATIGEVLPATPASEAELQRGDRILSIAGQEVNRWEEMTEIVRENPENPLKFIIERNGQQFTKTLIPSPVDEIDEEGNSHIVGKIGIGFYYEKKTVPFFSAFAQGLERTWFYTAINVKALGWLVTGKKSAKEMLGGPIMITKMAGEFARSGFSSLMELIAHLSIMLALINILPIPALDGGHIFIALFEGVRRKPLTTQTKVKIQQVGMAILFVLIIFVMYNDIIRLF